MTVDQMRELDRLAVEAGLALPVMMENAGRSLAQVADAFWDGERRVDVLAGVGGNGGGVAVAARHLANRGWQVTVHLAPTGTLGDVTACQVELVRLAGATVTNELPDGSGLVVDGLLGYGLSGAPREEQARLIDSVGGRPTVALDVPSGLELQTAVLHDPAIHADVTLTLAAPKHALRDADVAVGMLLLADIGVPLPLTSRPASHRARPPGRTRSSRSAGDDRRSHRTRLSARPRGGPYQAVSAATARTSPSIGAPFRALSNIGDVASAARRISSNTAPSASASTSTV